MAASCLTCCAICWRRSDSPSPIRVDHGSLLIRNGFTHYPQMQELVRLFPGDPNLPDRIVMLDGSGGLSFDALNWMSEQQIEFVRLNWRSEITNISGRSGYSGNSKLIQAQNKTRVSKATIEFARYLISEKIEISIQTLKLVIPKSENREIAISKLGQKYCEIRNSKNNLQFLPCWVPSLRFRGGCRRLGRLWFPPRHRCRAARTSARPPSPGSAAG